MSNATPRDFADCIRARDGSLSVEFREHILADAENRKVFVAMIKESVLRDEAFKMSFAFFTGKVLYIEDFDRWAEEIASDFLGEEPTPAT